MAVPFNHRLAWQVMSLVAMTILVRSAAVWVWFDHLQKDPDGYAGLAAGLVTRGEFALYAGAPTAFRPPLYPIILTVTIQKGAVAPVAVAALHVILGVLTVLLTFQYARWLGFPVHRAWIAGALVAVNPLLVNQSAWIMTETLAACLAVGACWQAECFFRAPTAIKAFCTGGCMALAALCRPAFFVWFVALMLAWNLPRLLGRGNLAARHPLGLLAGFAIVCLPWWARNYYQFREVVVTTTHGGYTLWLANNEEYFRHINNVFSGGWFHGTSPWSSEEFDKHFAEMARRLNYNEVRIDRLAARRAWQAITQNPGMAAAAALCRVVEFWNPSPRSTQQRPVPALVSKAVTIFFLCEYALALIGSWPAWRRPGLRILQNPRGLLVIGLCVVHMLYWSNARMRAPIEPLLALAACSARWYWTRSERAPMGHQAKGQKCSP